MLRKVRIVQLMLRLTGMLQIVMGVLMWTGNGDALRQAHMGLGLLFVLSLWALAALGFRARVSVGLAIRAAVWGIVVLWLGVIQGRLWPGPLHIYVRVAHLLVGLIAIGVGEALAARIKRAPQDRATSAAA
jgi:hypothetical protein